MSKSIRFAKGDLNYLAILQYPILWGLKAWAAKPENKTWVPAVPDWLLPFSLGVFLATIIFDVAFRKESRIRQVWHHFFDAFEIDGVDVGRFMENGDKPATPDSDVAVRLRVRFRKAGKYRCLLRIFECTGMERKPTEKVIRLCEKDALPGESYWIPIVDMASPTPGWNSETPRGWGPDKEGTIIGGSNNVVVFEAHGRWLSQRQKIFVGMVNYDRRQGQFPPCLHVQIEGDDLWNVTAAGKLGDHFDA
jgi:hypothetical protein